MCVAALSVTVALVALALGARSRSTRAQPALAAVAAVLSLGPLLYPPYTPLTALRFEAAGTVADAVVYGCVVLAWAWAGYETVRARVREADAVARSLRELVLGAAIVAMVVVVMMLDDESGLAPAFSDSWAWPVLFAAALAMVAGMVSLAVRRRRLADLSDAAGA